MKCRRETEMLHELVHDTLRKLEKQKLIRVVSWTNSWSTYLGVPATFHFFSNSVSTVSLIKMESNEGKIIWATSAYTSTF